MSSVPPFSLCEGGRFHGVLSKAGLTGGVRGRLILVALLLAVGWLPLILLTAAAGTLTGGVDHPLLADLGAWARALIVLPILVFAEPAADQLLGIVVELLRRTGLVRDRDLPAFEESVGRAQRRATSDSVEVILLLTALALPHLLAATLPHLATGTAWFVTGVAGEPAVSAAGRWYTWVALPLVQFLLLRWLWRIISWWGLVWRVSKLDLAWVGAHPDSAGGLGFLAWSPRAFRSVFVGLSALAAASVSNQIQFGGQTLLDARGPILAFLLLELVLLLGPQFFFLGSLVRTRYAALMRYGLTASAMTRAFEHTLPTSSATEGAELLTSPAPSAVADYASVYGLANAMRPAAISLREVVGLILPLAAPFAPLLLYQYSPKEILQQVLQLIH